MSKTVQFLRMPTGAAAQFIGLPGQVIVDTNIWTLRVQDGLTAGGFLLLVASNNLSDIANKALARSNLGLGSAALNNTTDFDAAGAAAAALAAAEAFSSNASNLASGTVPNTCFPAVLPAISGANLTNLAVSHLIGIIPANQGGAGNTIGIMKADGAGNVSAATANTDYLPVNNPTCTGIFSGPGGGTWNGAAIRNLGAIGLNCSPTYLVDAQGNNATMRLLSTSPSVIQRIANNGGEIGYIGDAVTLMGIGSAGEFSVRAVSDLLLDAGTGNTIAFFQNAVEKMRLGTDGSFLVGSTTGAGAGNIAATGNVISSYSDDRLKLRLGKITGALEKICSLEGFYYNPNELAVKLGQKYERNVGLSAQDVQRILPEVIKPSPLGPQYMTILYERTIPLLVEAIKELKAITDELRR